MELDPDDRLALITGGTSGIGRAIARAFSREGYRVKVTGKTREEVELYQKQEESACSVLDLQDERAIARLLSSIQRLDILVNSAGTILREGREFEPDDFSRVVDVNLNGTMRMCLSARALLAQSQGCILNIASIYSFFGSPYVPGYSASKGGVLQLTRSLAIAWADQGIRVNAIAPGWIATRFTEDIRRDERRNREILARTPLRRWGEPEDIAGAAVFLCSSQAAFITGAVLPVDGGYSIA